MKELFPGSGVRNPFAEAPSISNFPPSLSPLEMRAALQQSSMANTSPTASYSNCCAFHQDRVGPSFSLLFPCQFKFQKSGNLRYRPSARTPPKCSFRCHPYRHVQRSRSESACRLDLNSGQQRQKSPY